jgi:nucleotide-binding universal stress UspA family protein
MQNPAKPRLVVGYDGSELAKAALRGAAELFPGSPTVVVTVWEPGLAAMMAGGGGLDLAGGVPLAPDPELVSEVDHVQEHHAADVADSIVEVAAEREAAAVVIGSHGSSGLRSRLLGSTSHRVLASCKLPVVVVRSAAAGESG